MDNITSLNPQLLVKDFFEFHYQEQSGYAYVPTKHPITEEWEQTYYKWPQEKNELIAHVLQRSIEHEVYFSPALFTQKSAKKEYAKGTYTVWVEFDGNAPTDFGELPEPSMRVRSSEVGHEHVYWKLENFEVDVERIELINRSLAYSLGADTSGWDINQVLRPVGTINHKREGKNVTTLTKNSLRVTPELFVTLPVPSQTIDKHTLGDIPDPMEVIALYTWDLETLKFFRKKEIPTGSRSSALMRLGYFCAEMRMSTEEAYSILNNADMRWGKFAKRNDRERRLLDIITRAREKFPINFDASNIEGMERYNYTALVESDISVEWMVEDVIPQNSSILISAPPGTGKTQFTLQFAISCATGRTFLDWTIDRPRKILFFSLEMDLKGIKIFLDHMVEGAEFTPDERQMFEENFSVIPRGYSLSLDMPEHQKMVTDIIKEVKPDGIIFDALGSISTEELNEKTVKKVYEYLDRMRAKFGVFVAVIHHNRKANGDNKRPDKLADIFGSQYIAARPEVVLGLYPTPKDDGIVVSALKTRYVEKFRPFIINRTPDLNFIRASKMEGMSSVPKDEIVEEVKENKKGLPGEF